MIQWLVEEALRAVVYEHDARVQRETVRDQAVAQTERQMTEELVARRRQLARG